MAQASRGLRDQLSSSWSGFSRSTRGVPGVHCARRERLRQYTKTHRHAVPRRCCGECHREAERPQ